MSPQTVRRGFDPADDLGFAAPALARLAAAQEEIRWLLDRHYSLAAVLDLVGNQHQLTARQRMALQRSTASRQQCASRQARQRPLAAAAGAPLLIDGFNLMITLETALAGSPVLRGMDGVMRDLAGLRGTYRLIDRTVQAVELIGQILTELAVPQACFFLDAPVSNSGRLRSLILEQAAAWPMPVSAELVPDADAVLFGQAQVVSSDSVVLDACQNWINLGRAIIEQKIPHAWIISLDGQPSA